MRAMRNALLPLAGILLISCGIVGLLLQSGRVAPGQGGPALEPGIFRIATKASYRVDAAALTGASTTITGATSDPDATPWRAVALIASDSHPLTRALVLAMAERLTLAGARDGRPSADGVIAVVIPEDTLTTQFALPVDRILAVRHRSGSAPAHPDGPADAVLDLVERIPRLPADHLGAGLQAGAPFAERHWQVSHRHTTAPGASWPTWYAAVGRAMAETVLTTIGGDLPGHGAALDGWGWRDGPLIEPPQVKPEAFGTGRFDLLQWQAAFQTGLVRGWVGLLPTATYTKADGSVVPTIDLLTSRLVDAQWKFGGWRPVASNGPDRLVAKTLRGRLGPDAPQEATAPDQPWMISVRPHGPGWLVCAWHERPEPATVVSAWQDAASRGSATAAALCASHAGLPRLPR
jgi:hypothetical protein